MIPFDLRNNSMGGDCLLSDSSLWRLRRVVPQLSWASGPLGAAQGGPTWRGVTGWVS